MKGTIFNHLIDMVEEQFGLSMWDAVLTRTGHDGIYIASETYPDQYLFDLVGAIHEESDIPVNDLVRAFGEFSFPRFRDDNPQFFNEDMGFRDFLLTVDRIIHVEVRKLHPDASLPRFECEDGPAGEFIMHYTSPRKLCMLAEGLLAGAASHFNTQYDLDHSECMHSGAKSCKLRLQILPAESIDQSEVKKVA